MLILIYTVPDGINKYVGPFQTRGAAIKWRQQNLPRAIEYEVIELLEPKQQAERLKKPIETFFRKTEK